MKKLAYILSLLAAAAFTVVSCQKEVEKHEPGPKEAAGCYGVFFPSQDASGSHVYNPTQEKCIDIIVKRTSTNGAITVPVKATFSQDGIFTMNDISFADGQEETKFTLRFDNAEEGVNYSASFAIEDNNYASLYNSNPIALDFSVLCVEMKDFLNPKTGEPAVFTFTHNWSGSRGEGHATMEYYEVGGIRTCFFKSIDKDASGNPLGLWHGDPVADLTVRWYVGDQDSVLKPGTKASHKNNQGNDFVEIVTQYIGFDYNGGSWIATPSPADPINMYDYFWYWNMRGYSIEELNGSWLDDANVEGSPDQGYPLGYYDGNGGFFFYPYYFIPGLGGWSPSGYNNYFIAEGFTRVDYSFEVEADYPSGGATPISVEAGLDISSIKYAIYEGELTATQVGNKVAAISAGTDESVEFSDFEVDEDEAVKYATLEVSPDASGTYTFVAVAYGGEAGATPAPQASGSVTFKFISADDEADHAVDVYVFTEDTPARYVNYHAYDSFAYGIVGTDLTDVHVGIFKLSDVQKDVNGAFDAVKQDAKGNYAVSEDILAQINGDGGYYTIATKQPAKTNLIVLVWATNGDLETWDYSIYTTARLPYVWNNLGTSIYTEDVAGGLYGIGAFDVECNVYEEASTPGLYMIDGFQQNYIAFLFAAGVFGDSAVNENAADYEGILWRNCELVIDATNPKDVFIELQDYGICLDTDDGFIDGLTSIYNGKAFSVGTLENGVIAFPTVKGLLCTLNGDGYYYANQHGGFKVVLPAANAGAPSKAANVGSIESLSYSSFFKKMESRTEVFERDPQPVKVNATVSYDRKAMGGMSTIATRKAETR